MRVIISSHADLRIQQRLLPFLGADAREWVQEQVRDGRLAHRSPAWHGRKRVVDRARRFVRTTLDARGVLIVVERVATDILRVVTVMVQDVVAVIPIGRPPAVVPRLGAPGAGRCRTEATVFMGVAG